MLVPYTPDSALKEAMQKSDDEYCKVVRSRRIRIMENGGNKLINVLGRNDPWANRRVCEDEACPTCQTRTWLQEERKAAKREKQEMPPLLIQQTSHNCRREGLNYTLQCIPCVNLGRKTLYRGESSRSARQRHKEHSSDIELGLVTSPVVDHCILEHGGQKPHVTFLLDRVEGRPLQTSLQQPQPPQPPPSIPPSPPQLPRTPPTIPPTPPPQPPNTTVTGPTGTTATTAVLATAEIAIFQQTGPGTAKRAVVLSGPNPQSSPQQQPPPPPPTLPTGPTTPTATTAVLVTSRIEIFYQARPGTANEAVVVMGPHPPPPQPIPPVSPQLHPPHVQLPPHSQHSPHEITETCYTQPPPPLGRSKIKVQSPDRGIKLNVKIKSGNNYDVKDNKVSNSSNSLVTTRVSIASRPQSPPPLVHSKVPDPKPETRRWTFGSTDVRTRKIPPPPPPVLSSSSPLAPLPPPRPRSGSTPVELNVKIKSDNNCDMEDNEVSNSSVTTRISIASRPQSPPPLVHSKFPDPTPETRRWTFGSTDVRTRKIPPPPPPVLTSLSPLTPLPPSRPRSGSTPVRNEKVGRLPGTRILSPVVKSNQNKALRLWLGISRMSETPGATESGTRRPQNSKEKLRKLE